MVIQSVMEEFWDGFIVQKNNPKINGEFLNGARIMEIHGCVTFS